jgi:hypothetical protein
MIPNLNWRSRKSVVQVWQLKLGFPISNQKLTDHVAIREESVSNNTMQVGILSSGSNSNSNSNSNEAN